MNLDISTYNEPMEWQAEPGTSEVYGWASTAKQAALAQKNKSLMPAE